MSAARIACRDERNDEPCMCGTRFTCRADEHPPCDNCGGNPVTCDCDES